MLQDLLQELGVLAVEDGPLGAAVDVQQLEQDAEDDGDNGYRVHLADGLLARPLLTVLGFITGTPRCSESDRERLGTGAVTEDKFLLHKQQ